MTNVHLDWETFSELDIKAVGAYKYASHSSTEILCASVSTDNEGPYLWVNPKYGRSDPRATVLMGKLANGDYLVWAHNSMFEWAITRYRWKLDVRLPRPKLEQFRCTQTLSRCAGLPGSLDALAEKLGGPKKDPAGRRLISLLCGPQKDGRRFLPTDLPDKFAALGRYCLQDNRAERYVHKRLASFELKGAALALWHFDQRMNDRGVPVNVAALRTSLGIVTEAAADLGGAFRKITGLNPTQRDKVKGWLAERGLELDDMTAATLEDAADLPDLTPEVSKAMMIYAQVRFAAVKKIKTMLDCVCDDGWVRGTLVAFDAGTGRWTARLIQTQNMKKPTIKQTELAYEMICAGCSRAALDMVFGNALEVIASCIRHFIQWPGGLMLDADYNAIEARIVNWLAGQEDILQAYRDGIDQYKLMGARIYGTTAEKITKDQREVGKRAVLGCGFSMAWEKFRDSCWIQYRLKVSDEIAQKAVKAYRTRHKRVQEFWYAVDRAARSAIAYPGKVFKVGDHVRLWVATTGELPFLFVRLPSGRCIAYPEPKIEGGDRPQITFYGRLPNKTFGRVKTYGGKIVENITQATAFDYMAHGGVNAERLGFKIITVIHDQAPALQLDGQTVEAYCAALTEQPTWATGLPIKTEGRIIPFYKK